jgi:hypothetical protein
MYEQELPEFAVFGAVNTRSYEVIQEDPRAGKLTCRAMDMGGEVIDSFELSKGI